MRSIKDVILENGLASEIGDNIHYFYKRENREEFIGEILAIFQTKLKYHVIMINDRDDVLDNYKYSVIEFYNDNFVNAYGFNDLESAKKYFKNII